MNQQHSMSKLHMFHNVTPFGTSVTGIRLLTCSAFLILFIGQCQSQFRPPQVEISDRDTVGYTFLPQDSSEIWNAEYLAPLYEKMYQQRVRGGQKINIVHIGDSHILGNFLTREVRDRLQSEFGDAGRGLVFPYKLAGSNGPKDYLTDSNCKWNGWSCQRDPDPSTPFGISGFRLETTHNIGALTFRLCDTATSETKMFTKVTVFQRKTALEYDLVVKDDVTNQTAQLYLEDDYSRSFLFDRPVGQVTISIDRRTSQQKILTIDGVSLENELSGVIYHSIGVNGARYQDFGKAKYFARQVSELNPDLFILSFGTNESQGKTDPTSLYRTIDNLVAQLQEESPGALFLLTTPADSYLRGKGFNPNMADMSAVIRKYVSDKGFALWDLFNLSGGTNSALAWKSNGLMSSDSVHYSKAGYAAQGKLLYQSLIKGYNNFALSKP
jgi:lysophospholipase L1-like esterase